MPNDPTLSLPPSEQTTPDTTIPISGISYQDSFAASDPGQLSLSINDSGGTLSASDSGGTASGSGGNSITLAASYADVTDILNSLAYTAPAAPGSDTINFDIWDQAGVETTGTIPVTVASSGNTETWTGAVSTDWNTPGNWSGNAVPTSGDTAVIPDKTPNNATLANATLTGEDIIVNTGTAGPPTVSFTNVTLGAGTKLEASNAATQQPGTIDLAGTFTIASGATLEPQSRASLVLQSLSDAPAIINAGSIISPAFSTLAINNADPSASATTLDNTGLILADGGQLSLEQTPSINPQSRAPEMLTNQGTVEITNNGQLWMNGTFVSGDVTFNGTGFVALLLSNSFGSSAAVAGFGQGDSIMLGLDAGRQGQLSYNNNTMTVTNQGSVAQTINFVGPYTAGNFENNFIGNSVGAMTSISYAPDGGYSGIDTPDISAPASGTVAAGGSLSLGSVAVSNATSGTIDASAGTLFMNGATGSGTSQLVVGSTTGAQLNADLATLAYVPAAGESSGIVALNIQYGSGSTTREIPITVSGSSGGGAPTLNEPASETVATGGTASVSGSYSDSFAAGNPGSLFLGITDSTGTLSAKDASGNAVAGSGTNSITLTTDYQDLSAVLNSLTYTAGTSPGSDSISFDVWNQAGVETTDTVPVTVTSGGGSGGPTLSEPANASVAPGGTVAVGGNYSDSFAQGNSGSLFIGITDSSGTLSATDASGNAVAGSGSNSIALNTDFVDANAILNSLHYAAGASSGSDTIEFDVWNQAGVETTAATAVSIGAASAALADFAPAGPTTTGTVTPTTPASTAPSSMVFGDTTTPTVVVPHGST